MPPPTTAPRTPAPLPVAPLATAVGGGGLAGSKPLCFTAQFEQALSSVACFLALWPLAG